MKQWPGGQIGSVPKFNERNMAEVETGNNTVRVWAKVQRVRCANGGGHHRFLREGSTGRVVIDIGPCVHFPDVTP